MREPEMRRIAAWIGQVLASPDDGGLTQRVRGQVRELGQQFPAPA
jgi:glycine hydroxymethyltransferase